MSKDKKSLYFCISSLNEINIPDTVEILENGSLNNIFKKIVVDISRNVKKIKTSISTNIIEINVDENNENFMSEYGNLYSKDKTILYAYLQNEVSYKMPDTVKEIKESAFRTATNLSELILSEDLEKMTGWKTFYSTKVTKVEIPSKVNYIDGLIFVDETMNVTISADNPNFKCEDGTVILSKDGKKIIAVSKDLEIYDIPITVETIGGTAFYYKKKLKEIIIPENVKTIERRAFMGSSNLNKVEISSNIESMAVDVFIECNSLREIIINKKENEILGAPWGCPYGLRAVKWKK